MWEAGTTYGVTPLHLSLQGTRHHLEHFTPKLLAACEGYNYSITTRHILIQNRLSILPTSHSKRMCRVVTGLRRGQRYHIYRTLLKVIVHKSVPTRPGRSEPRVRKRRPKSYPLMQQPRHQYAVQLQTA
jgi:hypothetical protein